MQSYNWGENIKHGLRKRVILHRNLISSLRWPQSFHLQQLIPIGAQRISLLLPSCVHAACGSTLSFLLCNCLGFLAVSHMGKHLPVKVKVIRLAYIRYSPRPAGKSRSWKVITKIQLPFSCLVHISQTWLVHRSKKRVYDPCPFQHYFQDRPEISKTNIWKARKMMAIHEQINHKWVHFINQNEILWRVRWHTPYINPDL
jgi:hypothetical protein